MSAPESAAVVTPVAAEEVKTTETTLAVVDTKTEEPPVVADVVSPAVEAEAATEEPAAAEEVAKSESKAEAGSGKSPKLFSKLLSLNPFKGGEKKAKAPKSPKKEKKKEEAEATATAEAPKEIPAEVPAEVPAKVPAEAVKEVEPAVAVAEPATADVPAVVAEEDKETSAVKAEVKAKKVGRRLSARVGDFFRLPKPKSELNTPAKVDEHPPKIDKPEELAPLDPALEGAKVEEPGKAVEAVAPVVVAAA